MNIACITGVVFSRFSGEQRQVQNIKKKKKKRKKSACNSGKLMYIVKLLKGQKANFLKSIT